jgi:phosphoribosyl 1,2-cyclic phosphate phosphodiesterase
MKIQWLGTAAAEGWPAVFCTCEACKKAAQLGGKNIRTRAGAIVDDVLLIDLNPDLYAQKLSLGLDLCLLKDIIVTHNHGDHLTPLYIEFRKAVYYGKALPVIPIYGPYDIMDDLMPYKEYLEMHTVEAGDEFDTAMHHVTVLPAVHSAKNGKFYLIEREGKSFLYMHDTGFQCDEALEMLKQRVRYPIDVISMDCTYGPNPLPPNYTSHMGFAENIKLKERFMRDGVADGHTRFVSNHFSHNGHMLHEEMCKYMEPYGIEIAYDGMIAEI